METIEIIFNKAALDKKVKLIENKNYEGSK